MKHPLEIMKFILRVIVVLMLLSGCWTIAFFGTAWGYQWINWQPHALLRQIINSLVGFFVFGMFIAILSPFIRKKQMVFFNEMIDALKRISKGDFRVNLNARTVDNDFPFGKELITSINDMAVNLKAMEEMRQQFISDVSHEIHSPLTSISGFARAMICDELNREVQLQYLEIIDAESVRLSKLSDDLLRLASLNAENYSFHLEVFRLDKQMQLLILACEPHWLDKRLEVEVDLDEISIEADKNLLSQVWVNLIHNAIKFTSTSGKIKVSLERQGEHAVASIADTGIGISEEDQARIFERFFKADQARSRTTRGSGLGLSIVYKIVEMHNGNINVSSKLGEGTVFSVRLPLSHA